MKKERIDFAIKVIVTYIVIVIMTRIIDKMWLMLHMPIWFRILYPMMIWIFSFWILTTKWYQEIW